MIISPYREINFQIVVGSPYQVLLFQGNKKKLAWEGELCDTFLSRLFL